MSFKDILTKEFIPLLGFNISTFVISAFLIFVVILIFLKLKDKPINLSNGLKGGFITLSVLAFIFAFFNALTGEYLFSNNENIKVFMVIATISIFLYTLESIKELFG